MVSQTHTHQDTHTQRERQTNYNSNKNHLISIIRKFLSFGSLNERSDLAKLRGLSLCHCGAAGPKHSAAHATAGTHCAHTAAAVAAAAVAAPPIQVNYFSLHLTLVTRSICHADDHDDIARCPWLFSPGKSGNQETHRQTERQRQQQRQRSPLAEWQRQPHQSRPGQAGRMLIFRMLNF